MPTFSTSVCSFCIWLVPSLDDLAMGLESGAITLWMNIRHWNGAASWMTEDDQYFHLSHTDEGFHALDPRSLSTIRGVDYGFQLNGKHFADKEVVPLLLEYGARCKIRVEFRPPSW
jgi:hypothetical protein